MSRLVYFISQHINGSGPYEQNELSNLFVTPPCCYGDPSNICVSKFGCVPFSLKAEEAVKNSLNSWLTLKVITKFNNG